MRRITRWTSALVLGLTALASPAMAVDTDTVANGPDNNGSYGYLRIVESSAMLIQAGSSERNPADINQPVMVGDRIQVPDGSKVELVLSDHNLVRLDSGTDLVLEHLAASPDANDRATVLHLLEGDIQLVVTDDSLGEELPRVDTGNATVYPQDFGTYRIAADKGGWSEVTVRNGKAQVVTDNSSEDLGAGEQAVVEDGIDVREAPGLDRLETWAMRLDQDAEQQAGLDDVNEDLRYSASSLNRYGGWVTVENRRYWRPRVDDNWQPYTAGRWIYTPSGMTWISSEPWGWVPYHYGTWDFVPGYGWLWQPGYVYSPAWVYWYWGPSYTGWCPMGYYTRYYASVGFGGFHSGLYGWAGGDWGLFSHWTFVSSSYWRGYRDGYRAGFRDGHGRWDWDVRRHAVAIRDLEHSGRHLDRGLITTDTRPLRPDTWADPNRAVQVLRDPGRRGASKDDLPDVSAFVGRKPLPPAVAQVVKDQPNDSRTAGTPLRPATLGRGERPVRGTRIVPVPQNQGVAGKDQPGGKDRIGRRQGPQQVPTVDGGAIQPGRTGRNGGRQITPVTPSTKDQPSDRPSRRPAPGDQGGAPRPDRGNPGTVDRGNNRDRGTQVDRGNTGRGSQNDGGTPVDRDRGNTNRGNQNDRGTQVDRGNTNRGSQNDRGTPVDRGNNNRGSQNDRGSQTDRGNNRGSQDRGSQDRGNQDRGNQDRGNRDRGSQEKQSPPPKQDKEKDKDKPPSYSYRSNDRPATYGTAPVDRSNSRPAYTPQPQPQPSYRPAPPQPSYHPERIAPPPPPRPQPAPAPQRSASPSNSGQSSKPAERPHNDPPKRDKGDKGR